VPGARLARIVVAAALIAAARGAFAADDDVAFARALAQRGYPDVAERVLRRAAADAASPPARRAQSRLARAQRRRREARRAARPRAADPAQRAAVTKLFEAAEEGYRAIVAEPSSAAGARAELAQLLAAHAEYARRASGDRTAAPLLEEALRLVETQPPGATDDEAAWIRLLRMEILCSRAADAPPGDSAAADSLARALKEAESFEWDYAGTVRCAWAFRWKGLVLARLGRTREACDALRDAATAVTEREAVRGADEMAFAAYSDLAGVALSATGPDAAAIVADAMPSVERLASDWPRHTASDSGRRARLAVARLHDRAGDRARAAADARAVLDAAGDADPDAADEACRLLAEWTGSAGTGTSLDPATLSRLLRAVARGGDPMRTVLVCRSLIASCATPEDRDRYAWDAWDTMARAYGAAGRWYEAYLAFDRIETAWRADPSNARLTEVTDSTAWFRADALARLAAETKDAEDRAAADRAMSDFARDHPGSAYATGAQEQKAFRMLAEAGAMKRAGDAEGAKARAREALAALTAIGEDSALFDRAQALVAEAHRQIGDFARAASLAEAWLAAKRPEPTGPAARRSRDQARLQALATLLSATADGAAAADEGDARAAGCRALLAALAAHEKDYVALSPAGADQIAAWRAEALLGVGDVDAAEALVLEQIRTNPARPGTRWLAASTARALDASAAAEKDAAKARPVWLRAARLWEYLLGSSERPDAEVARAAGADFLAGGELARASDLLSLAAGLARTAAERATDDETRARAAASARAASVDFARALVALGRFDEAAGEASSALARDDADGEAVLARLASGETLQGKEVDWLMKRAALERPAVDALASALAGSGARERLAGAAQALAALRYTLPPDQGVTAESTDLALRHAETMLRIATSGGPREGIAAAATLLQQTLGTEEALARADAALPGARARAADLAKRIAEAEGSK
jgi:hypothetical protein